MAGKDCVGSLSFTNRVLIQFLANVSPCLKLLDVSKDLELCSVTAMIQMLGY